MQACVSWKSLVKKKYTKDFSVYNLCKIWLDN